MDTFYITRVTPTGGTPRFERHHGKGLIEVWSSVISKITDDDKPATAELWEIGPDSPAPWNHEPELKLEIDARG